MRHLLLAMVFVFLGSMNVALAEEEASESTLHPIRAQIETLKQDYNADVLALEASFNAGEMTAEEYSNAIITANQTLTTQVEGLRAQLASQSAAE